MLKRYWFLIGLLITIPAAVLLGRSAESGGFVRLVSSVPTSGCTAVILFLMSITLATERLTDALRRPAPVLVACCINQLIIPLMCLPLLLLQKSADLRVGLLIASCVPCTMAAASVWTRRAGGNDAVSLLVTLLTNGACFLIAPAWMTLGTRWFNTAASESGLSFTEMAMRLTLAALLPALAGQLLRIPAGVRSLTDRNKPLLATIAQLIILLLVFVAAFRGSLRFEQDGLAGNLRHSEFAFVWMCVIGLHIAAIFIGRYTSRLMNFQTADEHAVMMAGSQKTLPIGILLSQGTGMPFSLLPMLMYHTSQLFIDTWVADRIRPDAESRIETDTQTQDSPHPRST